MANDKLAREWDAVRLPILEYLEKHNMDMYIGCEDKAYSDRIKKIRESRLKKEAMFQKAKEQKK